MPFSRTANTGKVSFVALIFLAFSLASTVSQAQVRADDAFDQNNHKTTPICMPYDPTKAVVRLPSGESYWVPPTEHNVSNYHTVPYKYASRQNLRTPQGCFEDPFLLSAFSVRRSYEEALRETWPQETQNDKVFIKDGGFVVRHSHTRDPRTVSAESLPATEIAASQGENTGFVCSTTHQKTTCITSIESCNQHDYACSSGYHNFLIEDDRSFAHQETIRGHEFYIMCRGGPIGNTCYASHEIGPHTYIVANFKGVLGIDKISDFSNKLVEKIYNQKLGN